MTATPLNSSLDAIIAAIQQLPPEQRRLLQRRLRVSGLLVPEASVTDQQRLQRATALGPGQKRPPTAVVPSQNSPAPSPRVSSQPVQPSPETRPATPEPAKPIHLAADALHRAPISGKVVVGSPTPAAAPDNPHAMLPLPGQAPEQPIRIIFDGGSKGNPGLGYGSYALDWPGVPQQVVKLRFGNQHTNNEAEYDTLIGALEAVLKRLEDGGADPTTAKLDIRGDSLLVINQVLGKWQCKEPKLQTRRDRIRALLQRFGPSKLTHHDRSNSVKVLGH